MAAIAKLKEDMEFADDLGGIIEAFKTAALLQFRLFQNKSKLNNSFFREVEACFKLLSLDFDSPYFSQNINLPKALVVLTSDEGFLGELNTLLINAVLDERELDDEIIVLGERGSRYLEDIDENFMFFPGVSNKATHKEAESLYRYLLKGYNKKFGRVLVIYPEFLSLTVQKVKVFNMLPYGKSIVHSPPYYAKASKGRQSIEKKKAKVEILIEPSSISVAEGLVELWMVFRFLEIFQSSKQSEYAARVMHLEGSTQELSHLNRKLRLDYFKQLHSLSDKSIREISASKLLLKEEE